MKAQLKWLRLIKWVLFGYIVIFPWIIFPIRLGISQDERSIMSANITGVQDYFLFGKAVITIVTALVLLCLCLLDLWMKYKAPAKNISSTGSGNNLKQKKHVDLLKWCLFIYAGALILSSLLSSYRHVALFGGVNNCEGLILQLAYLVLFGAAAYLMKGMHSESVKNLKIIMILVAFVLSVLALVEFFGGPILQWLADGQVESTYLSMISVTFYNASCFGGFTILILPFVVHFWLQSESWKHNIFLGSLSALLIFCVIASKSTAAFYLMIVEVLMLIIWQIKVHTASGFKRDWYIRKVLTAVWMILLLTGIAFCSNGRLLRSTKDTLTNSLTATHKAQYFMVRDIRCDHDRLIIQGENDQLQVQLISDSKSLEFKDQSGDQIKYEATDGKMNFKGAFSNISAWIENDALVFDLGYKGNIQFYMYQNNFYPMLKDGTIVKDISGNQSGSLKNQQSFSSELRAMQFASGRGYIWMNTIPLLKDTLLIGHGPGTFELYFKQFDYTGLLNSQGNVDLIIDKPHSLYLQIAEQSGVLSAVAFIIFIILLIVRSFRLWSGDQWSDSIYKVITLIILCFAIFEGVTDSYVTVNPLFWILIGLLYGGIIHNEDVMRM